MVYVCCHIGIRAINAGVSHKTYETRNLRRLSSAQGALRGTRRRFRNFPQFFFSAKTCVHVCVCVLGKRTRTEIRRLRTHAEISTRGEEQQRELFASCHRSRELSTLGVNNTDSRARSPGFTGRAEIISSDNQLVTFARITASNCGYYKKVPLIITSRSDQCSREEIREFVPDETSGALNRSFRRSIEINSAVSACSLVSDREALTSASLLDASSRHPRSHVCT